MEWDWKNLTLEPIPNVWPQRLCWILPRRPPAENGFDHDNFQYRRWFDWHRVHVRHGSVIPRARLSVEKQLMRTNNKPIRKIHLVRLSQTLHSEITYSSWVCQKIELLTILTRYHSFQSVNTITLCQFLVFVEKNIRISALFSNRLGTDLNFKSFIIR